MKHLRTKENQRFFFLHFIITFFGAAYLAFVFVGKRLFELHYVQATSNLTSRSNALFFLLVGIVSFLFFFWALESLQKHAKPLFFFHRERGRIKPAFFLSVAFPILLVYLLRFASHYPGAISGDTYVQWQQIHTMRFNDHHPFFHTFLLFLFSRIGNSFASVIFVQQIAFALGVAYLAATLDAWGFRRRLIALLTAVIVLGPATQNLMLYAWKDTALSIFFLYLLPQMINIFLSRGKWLHRPGCWISFSILLACITLVRHNAILFTGPLLALIPLCFQSTRKAFIKVLVCFCAVFVLVKGPLYTLYNVTPAASAYHETMGLPMTILCTAYDELLLSEMEPELYDFMSGCMDHKVFRGLYETGNYNSVKFDSAFSAAPLNAMPPADFLKLVFSTVQKHPALSARAVLELTDIVWDPLEAESGQYGLYQPPVLDDMLNVTPIDKEPFFFMSGGVEPLMERFFANPTFEALTSRLGLLIVIMLVSWYVSMRKLHGWISAWFIAPIMLYNFGTMLLLCGNDFRFFHFNCLAAFPIVLVLLSSASPAAPQPVAK